MINVQEFYESIVADVSLSANLGGTLVEDEFLIYALDQLVDCGEINQYDLISDGRDAAGAWRIDAISYDNDSDISNSSISLFISLFEAVAKPSNLIKTELDVVLKKLKRFVEFALEKDIYKFFEPGSDAFSVAEVIKNGWIKGLKNHVRFIVITNRPASNRIKDLELLDIRSSTAEVIVWDLNRLFHLELSGREREDLEIDLSCSNIPVLLATNNDKDMKSVLAIMPATVLVNLYAKWGSRLLEQNVRSFLTAKGKVNKGLKDTIKNTPSKFFAFNNGITGTAEFAKFESKSGQLYLTHLKNFQIVNGGQTTASLFAASFKDNIDITNIFVQMKLSVVTPELAKVLVPFISRFANSQNKVTEADLFSNHPFHIRFEEFSRRIMPPTKPGTMILEKWFYERARGQYLNEQVSLSSTEKIKFKTQNPKNQVITKTALAKYINSFELLPYFVSRGAEINFVAFAQNMSEKWSKSDSEINEGFFKKAIASAIVFKEIEQLISKQKDTWYNGHRDKIVPYTISFLMYAIKINKQEFDFEIVWKRQCLDEKLRNIFANIAEVINSLLNNPDRPIGNVAEYAKKEIFWSTVQDLAKDFDISQLDEYLVGKNIIKERNFDEKNKQKLTDQLQIETKVKTTSLIFWKDLHVYLKDNNLDSPQVQKLLENVISKPMKLSPLQCKNLYKLMVLFENEYRE